MSAPQQIPPRTLARGLVISLLLVALGVGMGCDLPKGDTSSPKGVHYAVIQARLKGDTDALWALLHPASREALDQWVAAEKSVQRIVVVDFPKKVQPKALSTLTVNKFKDGKTLFKSLLGDKGGALETWNSLGAHVLTVDTAGDNATVHTWGGDDLRARKAGDKWFAVLPKDLDARLMASSKQAVANLKRVKELVSRLKH